MNLGLGDKSAHGGPGFRDHRLRFVLRSQRIQAPAARISIQNPESRIQNLPSRAAAYVAYLCLSLALTLSVPAYTISGTVIDNQAKPVPNALVWLNQDRTPKKAECDANGAFTFQDVAVGPVEIVAWKDGYSCGGLDALVAGDAAISIALGEPDTISARIIERRIDPRTAASTPPSPIVGASVLTMYVNDAFHVSVEDLSRLGFPNPRSDDQ